VTLFTVKNHFRYDIIREFFEGGTGGSTNATCK